MTAEIHLTLINNLESKDSHSEMKEIYMLFLYISNSPSSRPAQVPVGCWGPDYSFLLLTREPTLKKIHVLSKTD